MRLLAEGGVSISDIGLDKYGGRVLASASTRTTPDISDALLKTGLVRPYEGGWREGWCGRSHRAMNAAALLSGLERG